MPFGHQFKRCAIEIEAAEVVRQSLAIVLIPNNRPLRKKMGRIRVPCVLRNGPRKQFSLSIESDRPARDGGFIHSGGDGSNFLRRTTRRENEDYCEKHARVRVTSSHSGSPSGVVDAPARAKPSRLFY